MVVSLSYNSKVPIYECPRCRGNDVYFGTRQEIKYTSGAFPEQYLANVQKALCRQCAEPMTNKGPTPQEAKAAQDVVEAKVNFIFSKTGLIVILLAFLVACLTIYVIGAGINDWVQCWDGYEYASEKVDGETRYINKCDP